MESTDDVKADGRRLQAEHNASGLEGQKRAWEQKDRELKDRRNQNAREEDVGKREYVFPLHPSMLDADLRPGSNPSTMQTR